MGVLDRYGYNTYGLWDIYLARSTGRIHPFLQLTNLTNTSYQEVQMKIKPCRSRAVVAGVEVTVFTGEEVNALEQESNISSIVAGWRGVKLCDFVIAAD